MMNNQKPLARDRQLHGSLHIAGKALKLPVSHKSTRTTHWAHGLTVNVQRKLPFVYISYSLYTVLQSLYIDMCLPD